MKNIFQSGSFILILIGAFICYSAEDMIVCGHRLTLTFTQPHTHKCNLFCRLIRLIAFNNCKVLCKLFNQLVRPVSGAVDQLLYLYFYLPSVFRRALLLHGRNHRNRKRQKKFYKATRKNIKKVT